MAEAATEAAAEPVDALLFDLGGVIMAVDFDRAFARWAAHAGCDPARLTGVTVLGEAYERHERGEISHTAYFDDLGRRLDVALTDAQWLDGWNAIFVGEMPGIATLLAQAGARVPLYAFTNTNAAHEAFWSKRHAPLVARFKTIFVSSTLGLRKPELEAFQHVVKAIGAPASRILFFDDLEENVRGARAAGLQAVQVTGPTIVAETLARLGFAP